MGKYCTFVLYTEFKNLGIAPILTSELLYTTCLLVCSGLLAT
jgi:hypothetical protein